MLLYVRHSPNYLMLNFLYNKVTTRLSKGSMEINFGRFFPPCSSSELQICGVTFWTTVSLVLATVITSYLAFCCYSPRHVFSSNLQLPRCWWSYYSSNKLKCGISSLFLHASLDSRSFLFVSVVSVQGPIFLQRSISPTAVGLLGCHYP